MSTPEKQPTEAVCDGCHKRAGKLTHQYAHGPCGMHGEVPRFVFRGYHCRWCLAAENRQNKRAAKPLWRHLEWKPDAEMERLSNRSREALDAAVAPPP